MYSVLFSNYFMKQMQLPKPSTSSNAIDPLYLYWLYSLLSPSNSSFFPMRNSCFSSWTYFSLLSLSPKVSDAIPDIFPAFNFHRNNKGMFWECVYTVSSHIHKMYHQKITGRRKNVLKYEVIYLYIILNL